jgi:hypothetical protein
MIDNFGEKYEVLKEMRTILFLWGLTPHRFADR